MSLRTALVATATAALLPLAACGADADDKAGGTWTFTDGRGEKISLAATPKNLVVQTSVAAALNDLGVDVPVVFGPLVRPVGSTEPEAGSLDPKKVVDVTGSGDYGTLDLEKLSGEEPDLLISYTVVPPELWYVNAETEKDVEKLVQTLALNFADASLEDQFEAVEELAEALGADVDDDAVEADFENAADRIRTIGAELKAQGKTILASSATPDLMYAGDPKDFADLAFYQELGLPIVEAKANETYGYWEELSWEKADKYDADILLWDQRGGDATLAQFRENPAFGTTTAGKAEAYIPWNAVSPPSRTAYVDVINELADALEKHL